MKKTLLFLLFSQVVMSSVAMAMNYELSVSYARKKNSFDQDNYLETESATGSVSLYFTEKVALELSYTDAKATRNEKPPAGTASEVFQKTEVLGADLILILMDRKSWIQPYIKGGAAQLKRTQTTYLESSNTTIRLPIETAVVPSYGAGLKFILTQTLSLRLSYDAWRTPVGGGSSTDDTQIRAGISWML